MKKLMNDIEIRYENLLRQRKEIEAKLAVVRGEIMEIELAQIPPCRICGEICRDPRERMLDKTLCGPCYNIINRRD